MPPRLAAALLSLTQRSANRDLRSQAMESLQPRTVPQIAIPRAYMVLHSRGTRVSFQRAQLPFLGVDTRLVTGFDAEELTPAHRTCLFPPDVNTTMPLFDKHASQLIKTWAALYNMINDGLGVAMIMEDDAVIHFERLPAVSLAIQQVLCAQPEAGAVLHLSSYSPIGHDMTECGGPTRQVKEKLWAGVANVVTAATARWLLGRGQIYARGIDVALSLHFLLRQIRDKNQSEYASSLPASDPMEFAVKPFAVTAGAYGPKSLFHCNLSIKCEAAWYRMWSTRANYSTWISQRLDDESANSSTFNIPLDGGCPELLDCGSIRPGILTARHGHRCLPPPPKCATSRRWRSVPSPGGRLT